MYLLTQGRHQGNLYYLICSPGIGNCKSFINFIYRIYKFTLAWFVCQFSSWNVTLLANYKHSHIKSDIAANSKFAGWLTTRTPLLKHTQK